MTTNFDRRDFLKTSALTGAGLIIGIRFAGAPVPRGARDDSEAGAAEFAPNAYLRIGTDNSVTLFADHVELGQGVLTALPMIVAEELDADWASVKIERMPADPSSWPRSIMTVGSQSVRGSWQPLRRAGASAREMLIDAAAKTWDVDRSELRAERGAVLHDRTRRRATYGELAAVAATMTPPQNPPLKNPSQYRIIGKRQPRVDIPSKVDGSAKFGIDVRIPGMLIATVIRPPVFGDSIKALTIAPRAQCPA